MNQQNNDKEAAKIGRRVSQSGLIAALDIDAASPLATVEASCRLGSNARHFVRKVKAYHEDLTECQQEYGKDSEKYKALLAKAHSCLDYYLPEFLDLVVLGHISNSSSVPSL